MGRFIPVTWANGAEPAISAENLQRYELALASDAFLPISAYASPDTYTDLSTTVQTWLNDCKTYGKIALWTPGEWWCHVTVPHGLTVLGVAAGGYESEVEGNYQTHLGPATGSTSPVLTFAAGTAHQVVQGLHLDGSRSGAGGPLISIAAAGSGQEAQVRIDRCYLSTPAGTGVAVGANRRACKITGTSIVGGSGVGVDIQASDTQVSGCIIGGQLGHGINVGESIAKIHGNELFDNLNNINVAAGVPGFSIVNNGIDRAQNHGVYVSAGGTGTMVGNVLHQNGTAAANTYSHITLASGIGDVAIVANAYQADGLTSGTTPARYGVEILGGAGDAAKVHASCNVAETGSWRTALYSVTPTGT